MCDVLERGVAQRVKMRVEEERARGFFIDANPSTEFPKLLHHREELGGLRIGRQGRWQGLRRGLRRWHRWRFDHFAATCLNQLAAISVQQGKRGLHEHSARVLLRRCELRPDVLLP
jgi:hypothetical protein